MRSKQLVDTNVLVRFFTGEPPAMADNVRGLVARADAGEITLMVLPLVVAEAYFTLEDEHAAPLAGELFVAQGVDDT